MDYKDHDGDYKDHDIDYKDDDDKMMTVEVEARRLALPCHVADADLWFAESPADLERAKALCADCPIRSQCLAAALDRAEPWGVWGGEILEQGTIVARKRPRGRPRKNPLPDADTAAA